MRAEGWEAALTEYLHAAACRPLAWGAHDCALWAAGWVKLCTGADFLGDWLGTYSTERGAARAIRRRGFRTAADIADAHLREKEVSLARRGDLVLHPTTGSLGVCNGRTSQFTGAAGAIPVDTLACAAGLGRLMPVAVPLVAAAAGAAVASTTIGAAITLSLGLGFAGAFTASALAGAVVATGINYVGSRALAKKPKASSLVGDAAGRALTFRSPAESQKVVYGRVKVSGPLAFVHTATDGPNPAGPSVVNRFLHYVLPLAGHPIDAVEQVYLNDLPVEYDANGFVTTAPYGKTTATETQVTTQVASTTFAAGIVTVATPVPHGFAAGEHGMLQVNTLLANNQSLKLTGMVEGRVPFTVLGTPTPTSFTFANTGTAGNPITGGSASVNRTATVFMSFVRLRWHVGAPGQTASPELQQEAPGSWTAAHRGQGISYLELRYEKSDDAFPSGPPNPSAVIRGKPVYDPRTGATAWSQNAALCANDYLTSRDGSAVNQEYGYGIAQGRIDSATLIASANVCDEPVLKRDGTYQPRYTCNGVLDTAASRSDNLSQLLTAMAGVVTEVQDGYRVRAAYYEPPVADIGIDDLAGDVQVLWRPTRKDVFNTVRGVYVDPSKGWQPTDFPPVTSAYYVAEDGGERLPKDIELPFTTDSEAAQRLAKVTLEKGRQGITVELTLKHSAVRFGVWDVVSVTNAQLGWAAKPFRVTGWRMPDLASPITMTLQEEAAASYDWNRGEATASDPAPDTNLPNPFFVQPPGALRVTEEKYRTRGVGVKVRAVVAWEPSPDVNTARYLLEYRLRGAPAWNPIAQEGGTRQTVEDISPGVYEFRVKALSTLGVSSEYSTATVGIVGLLDPPLEPQHLTLSSIGGMAFLRWDPLPDLDVVEGGSVVFRHSPDETDAWHQSTTIGVPVPGLMTSAMMPLKAGVYLAKSVDSSGVESVDYASVTTAQATALAFANLSTLTESPTFSGTKTGTTATGGALKLESARLLDDEPDFDAIISLDALGGITAAGTYAFSGGIDLGAVTPVRVTGRVRGQAVNELDTIDTRTDLIDSWASFDGDLAAGADAVLYARTTPDDPSGTPVWGAWHRLDSAEYQARAFEFELRLTSDDAAYNFYVSELSATVEEVA